MPIPCDVCYTPTRCTHVNECCESREHDIDGNRTVTHHHYVPGCNCDYCKYTRWSRDRVIMPERQAPANGVFWGWVAGIAVLVLIGAMAMLTTSVPGGWG